MDSGNVLVEEDWLKVEVDDWGGVHFHFDQDELKTEGRLSLNPEITRRLREGFEELDGDSDE